MLKVFIIMLAVFGVNIWTKGFQVVGISFNNKTKAHIDC